VSGLGNAWYERETETRTHVDSYTRCLSTSDDPEENSAEARAGRQGSGLWRTGTSCIFESSVGVWGVACTVIFAVCWFSENALPLDLSVASENQRRGAHARV
jgi:hypothetical protein